jgi:hypothetical protein
MNLIDPFQFRELFAEARSFAIVGNAPTILEYENGAAIDGCDVVVRFNRATTIGVEEKIGSRTDILVVNASNSLAMAPPPSKTSRPRCLVSYVSPQGVPNVNGEEFANWVGDLPILLTFGPDLIDLPSLHHTRPMTSGTYFLLTVMRMLSVERLFVTGFTMFGAKGGVSGKYYADSRLNAQMGGFHDLDVESQIFAALIRTCSAECQLTPEVESVVRAIGAASSQRNGKKSSRRPLAIRKRIAAGLSWRAVEIGMRLRRFADSR